MNYITTESMILKKSIAVLDSTMNYLEAGEGDPIVFLHGNPTSSYLWRNIIPFAMDEGRCLAPDLIGMGESAKSPANNYFFKDHVEYLDDWFIKMGIQEHVTLVLHDWGSALGFYWAYRNPEKIKAIVYMESIVQPRVWSDFPNGRDEIFKILRSAKGEQLVIEQNFFIETVLPKSIIRVLDDEEMNTYREPFKAKEHRLPTLQFARELPINGEPADIAEIVEKYGAWLKDSPLPKLLIVAEPGALLTGRNLKFCRTWANQKEITVKGIHYIQEDSPTEIGTAIREFLNGLK